MDRKKRAVAQVREKLEEIFFQSPQRRKIGLFNFGVAAVFLSLYIFRDGGLFTLTMFSGFLLTGLSEYLPEERSTLAGILRLTAIAAYTTILVLSFVRPEILF
jgi:uncharacterized membrane protein YjjP (DUF1212 family)